MDPINKIGLFKPITPLASTEGINGGASAKRVQPASNVEGYNPAASISKIDGEVTPTLGTTGSSYTNGIGHSQHTKNWLF